MKITLITACRNSKSTIGCTLDSVRRQVLPAGVELEYLVIDGVSTDGTVGILRDFERRPLGAGRSFRYLSEPDRGLYDAINKGIALATGEVVGVLNADDVLAEDDTLSKLASGFDANVDIVYADVRFVKDAATVESLRLAKTIRYCTGRFFRNWMFRFATFPAHPSTFVRLECYRRFGGYSLDYRICADFELMLRFFVRYGLRARYLPICTTVMRMGGPSTNGIGSNLEINREDLRALRANGVWSAMPLIYLKYLFKIWGFLCRRQVPSAK